MVDFLDRIRSLFSAQGKLELIWAELDPERIRFLKDKEIASNLHVLPKLGIVAGEVRSGAFQSLLDSGVVPLGLNEVVRVRPVEHVIASAGPAGGNWGVDFLGLPEFWANTKGDGVTVAILDSGVDGSHPAFEGRVFDTSYVIDYAGRVQQRVGVSRDSGYHGTHVASIVAANQVRLPSEDVVSLGMAPAARICNIQVLERDAGTVLQVIGGMEAILDLGIDIDVVNLSAEVGGQNAAFVPAVRALVEKGIIVVVAAGNTGEGVTASPGNYPYELAFSVGAHAEDGSVWPSSNGAITVWDDDVLRTNVPVPTISAPGVKILGAAPGGGLKMLSGTSMAAPHVAGICALLKSSNKQIKHIEALELLKDRAKRFWGGWLG